MQNTIGQITTYHGAEHGYLLGHKVRIVAILKGSAHPDDDGEGAYITDDRDLADVGGVTADDRVEVQPWLELEGRFSFVSSDSRALDLACFAHLLNP